VLRLTWHYVSSIKVDPYLNVDAGTMNPKEYAQTLATPPKY
jgi:CTP synthase (UTP-ammonia lyase)